MLPAGIDGLPLAGQLVIFAIGGFGYAVAIAIAYLRGLPKKSPDQASGVAVAGALIDSRAADEIIAAIEANTRAVDRLERAVDRNCEAAARLADDLAQERRQIADFAHRLAGASHR